MAQKLQRRAMAPAWSIGVTTPVRAILHLVVVLAMLALCAGQARAVIIGNVELVEGEDEWTCSHYATNAVRTAKNFTGRFCGQLGPGWGTGPRWSQDTDEHFSFCRGQKNHPGPGGNPILNQENAARAAELQKCIDHQTWVCEDYSYVAEGLAFDKEGLNKDGVDCGESSANACSGTGARWSTDRDAHRAFCMSQQFVNGGFDTLLKEQDARREVVRACAQKPKPPPAPTGIVTGRHKAGSLVTTRDRDPWVKPPGNGITGVVTGPNSLVASKKAQQLHVARVDASEPQPVVTGGTGGVSPATALPARPLPTGPIGATPPIRVELDPKHKLPPDLFKPKWPSMPPATGGTGGVNTSKPGPTVPSTPPATGGTGGVNTSKPGPTVPSTLPATGGTGGVNTSKPGPTVPSTPPATGGTGGVNTSKPGPTVPSTPPASGGTGGVNTSKPGPTVPSTPPASGGTGGVNTSKPGPTVPSTPPATGGKGGVPIPVGPSPKSTGTSDVLKQPALMPTGIKQGASTVASRVKGSEVIAPLVQKPKQLASDLVKSKPLAGATGAVAGGLRKAGGLGAALLLGRRR